MASHAFVDAISRMPRAKSHTQINVRPSKSANNKMKKKRKKSRIVTIVVFVVVALVVVSVVVIVVVFTFNKKATPPATQRSVWKWKCPVPSFECLN